MAIVLALALDFMQYVVASGIWGAFARIKEAKVDAQASFEAPAWLNWPALWLFWGKVIVMAGAYLMLFLALFDRV